MLTVTNLLDYALPFTASDLRCGMKKKAKTEKRLKLASLLNDLRNGKHVDLRQVNILVDYNTFEVKVNEWIGSLITS